MRKIFVAFDDTDNLDGPYGTGKVARWFLEGLPEGLTAWGVVRQQLLVHDDIPFTSHNSSACIVLVDEGGTWKGTWSTAPWPTLNATPCPEATRASASRKRTPRRWDA